MQTQYRKALSASQPCMVSRPTLQHKRYHVLNRSQLHAPRLHTRTLVTEAVAEVTTAIDQLKSVDNLQPELAVNNGKPINWFQQWYPLAILQDLDPRRPTATKLLGIPLVVWRDGTKQWRAFEDRCPHRLAPLSEGRIDTDGTLMCSYHGE
eukprot:GHRR01024162.1.p1 GENE.GHRR01024162.1~~GHRR01024162.1.p1  ORF type:complete len:151 (+),score=24.46 GHRR01024162.1:161-613(+)